MKNSPKEVEEKSVTTTRSGHSKVSVEILSPKIGLKSNKTLAGYVTKLL